MGSVPRSGEYADGQLWFHRKGKIVTIGLTSNALDEVGAVKSIELPQEGDDFNKGEAVATINGNHGKLDVTVPASGMIQEVNTLIIGEPALVSEDPLEEGWIIKIDIQDTSDLMEFVDSD